MHLQAAALPPPHNILDMDLSETYWHCFDSSPACVRQANHVYHNIKYNAYWAPRENNVYNNNNNNNNM